MANKKDALECLFTEINILTECRHKNVVKILDASFDGTLVKEQLVFVDEHGSPGKKEENLCNGCEQEKQVAAKLRHDRGDLFGDYGDQAYDAEEDFDFDYTKTTF